MTKPITGENAAVYKDFLCNKLIPAIKDRWPDPRGEIKVQEDEAPAHTKASAAAAVETAREAGLQGLYIKKQPPQSPQFNALDC